MSLEISKDLSLPLSSATWVIAYLAKRGAGKTYAASVQAEEMLRNHIPIIVIDGMSTWWGLRVSNDAKSDGYPIVVFGGEHADLPLDTSKVKEMVRAIVESDVSCVLDLSDLSQGQSERVVESFLTELYRINRAARHIFIEEADLWAPQKPMPDQTRVLHAVDTLVRRGGNRNLGCTLITQRSAVLNKNILTQADCLVVLRTLAPQDKKAVQEWVEQQADKDKTEGKKWYDSLKTLENGQAYVWHPEKPVIFQKVMFRHRETFHATREFITSTKAGKVKLMDVGQFISKFRRVFEGKEPAIEPVVREPDSEDLTEVFARIERLEAILR